jgi:hypothetical protein
MRRWGLNFFLQALDDKFVLFKVCESLLVERVYKYLSARPRGAPINHEHKTGE